MGVCGWMHNIKSTSHIIHMIPTKSESNRPIPPHTPPTGPAIPPRSARPRALRAGQRPPPPPPRPIPEPPRRHAPHPAPTPRYVPTHMRYIDHISIHSPNRIDKPPYSHRPLRRPPPEHPPRLARQPRCRGSHAPGGPPAAARVLTLSRVRKGALPAQVEAGARRTHGLTNVRTTAALSYLLTIYSSLHAQILIKDHAGVIALLKLAQAGPARLAAVPEAAER